MDNQKTAHAPMEFVIEKKRELAGAIKIEGIDANGIYQLLAVPQDNAMGDYCLPCFKFAGQFKKSPMEIAKEIAESFNKNNGGLACAEAVSGYVNFKYDKFSLANETLNKVFKEGGDFGSIGIGGGRTVIIDYSSINIAKPFHIGHLSTTVIGGALYRIYKKAGFNAFGINHLGDWGTQFGKLISAFKMWGDRVALEKRGVDYLTELYVKFHAEAKINPSLNDDARKYFKQLEDGEAYATNLFNEFKEITLEKVKEIYTKLDISFDSYNGEAFYNDKMQPVLNELEEKGLLKLSEGAKVVDLDAFGMPPCLLVKEDGATLYATRDLSAVFYRKNSYNFYKCLYVVAYQQNLHFKQFFKVVELMGKDWAKDLVHVPFGMVSLESGAMSTREGNVVKLTDVLEQSVSKAYEIIKEKNAGLKDKERVAKEVGVGAVVFFALSNNRIKDIVFSYDKVLNFDGETAPYVQYTNARASSVLRKLPKAVLDNLSAPITKGEFEGINNKESDLLISLIDRFPSVINEVLEKYEPSILTRHLIDIAKAFNKFYYEHRIINAEEAFIKPRAKMAYAVNTVLTEGLRLIGIASPKEM
ncbi:MAG: arginine--tRNA ligase [Firmicutes bacterium]|nr:arginine--tRNA ligase [Bacillota bacterium]